MKLSTPTSSQRVFLEKPSLDKIETASRERLDLEESLEGLRLQIMRHPLYDQVSDENLLCRFMEFHVFSVWDFQSLIKSLQIKLTCISIPWLPSEDPEARRLMNEIILNEESGPHPDGGFVSHFELYLDAMDAAGADRSNIQRLINELQNGKSLEESLKNQAPLVQNYLRLTFQLIERDSLTGLMVSF